MISRRRERSEERKESTVEILTKVEEGPIENVGGREGGQVHIAGGQRDPKLNQITIGKEGEGKRMGEEEGKGGRSSDRKCRRSRRRSSSHRGRSERSETESDYGR